MLSTDTLSISSLLALASAGKLADAAKEALAHPAPKEGGIVRLTYSWEAKRAADAVDAIIPYRTPWEAIALHALARLSGPVAEAAILAATLPGEAPPLSPAIAARLDQRKAELASRGTKRGALTASAELLSIEGAE